MIRPRVSWEEQIWRIWVVRVDSRKICGLVDEICKYIPDGTSLNRWASLINWTCLQWRHPLHLNVTAFQLSGQWNGLRLNSSSKYFLRVISIRFLFIIISSTIITYEVILISFCFSLPLPHLNTYLELPYHPENQSAESQLKHYGDNSEIIVLYGLLQSVLELMEVAVKIEHLLNSI